VKPVLTPTEAAALDRATRERGVPTTVLMERAGLAVARSVVDLSGGVYGRRATVVCGKGNNGGDGLVAARHLSRWGMRVGVVMMEDPQDLREPAAAMFLAARAEPHARIRVFSAATLEREVARADVVVDAIFGTGFRGMPDDDWAEAIAAVNASVAAVVAVDIPSGVDGATGAVAGEAVRADLTVTFGAAKVGAILLPGAERAGTVRVVDIGFPDELLRAGLFLPEPEDVAGWLPRRPVEASKYGSGVVMVIAGSRGMTGAPRLIARAAGRVGVGLVQLAVPEGVLEVEQAALADPVFVPLPETRDGTVASAALETALARLERADALAVGPGLSMHDETGAFVRELVRTSPVPIVADADALNAFAGRASDLADRRADAVLTPHAGEFARLTGVKPRDLEADRLAHVRALAAETSAVVLLKGSRTLVVAPDGEARVNPTGTPVLATAGSGDVLTGVIGGLLARGVAPFDAATAGAYVHGLAGVIAGRLHGEGTIASDLVDLLPEALADVSRS
jgi:NAD(P)H-hydrate epimerase